MTTRQDGSVGGRKHSRSDDDDDDDGCCVSLGSPLVFYCVRVVGFGFESYNIAASKDKQSFLGRDGANREKVIKNN